MTFSEQFPRAWLRALAIGVGVSGSLWIGTGVAWRHPSGALMVLIGVFLLPIGLAMVRNLDGMAVAWGRYALAPFRIRRATPDLDDDIRERVAAVREEGAGRQAGAGMILIALGWIAMGGGILLGVFRA